MEMTLIGAIGYYAGRLVVFSVIAGIGIAAGIKIRKNKNAKSTK